MLCTKPSLLFRFATLAFTLLFFFSIPAFTDTIKVVHIKNPGPAAADMHVTHFGNVKDTRGVTPGSTTAPSDTFNQATGVGSPTVNYSMGTLGNGATDNYSATVTGNLPAGGRFVTKVEFTDGTGGIIRRLDPNGTPQEKRDFANNVKGFTNRENFDFSNLNDAHLFLFGEDFDLNIQVTLSNFAVFKDLPLSNFNPEDYQDTSTGILAFSTPSLVISPGASVDIPLGAVNFGTYALATVGTITVEDFTTDTTTVFDVPQSYAQDIVPEPSTVILVGVGALLLGYRTWLSRRIRR